MEVSWKSLECFRANGKAFDTMPEDHTSLEHFPLNLALILLPMDQQQSLKV